MELYPINPRLTANFKKTFVDLDHCDPIDAFVIADRLRLLTRYRFHLAHNLAREKAYCLAILYLKASE